MGNVSSLTSKTTMEQFLQACDGEERECFSRLFAALDAAGIAYQVGTKGFSASRVFRGCPTFGSRLHGMHLRMEQVPEDKRDQVREMLATATGRARASLTGDRTITFTAKELPEEAVCDVVKNAVEALSPPHKTGEWLVRRRYSPLSGGIRVRDRKHATSAQSAA